MAYLANSAQLHSLTINGADYTSSLVSWKCSDASANKQGIITTSGELVLGQVPGGYNVEDYDRDNFKRGVPVILQVTFPDGTTARHPRGLLYVISTSYSPEENELTVELGCKLALSALTEEVDDLVALSPIHLDPTQRAFSNISAAFASAGKYLYQDNYGNLVSDFFFKNDSTSGVAPGEWTSVLGVTALSARPLAGTGAIPDIIELTYRIPAGLISDDNRGKVDLTTTESYYYITYPAVMYQRVGEGLGSISGTQTAEKSTGKTSACGNTPSQPSDNGTPSCNEGYETVQTPLIIPAKKTEYGRTEYDGPAGQVSRVFNETYGPALEANGQYFADKYAYCRNTWATRCQPNGGCPTDGEQVILLAYSEQTNYYGTANELVKTVTDNYATTLSAAQPFNWRSGVVNGVAQDFQTLSVTDMYRESSVIVEYSTENNTNKQETTTYTSATSRQSGINGDIDALSGIKTFQRRLSTTISASPLVPDMVNNASTSTEDKTIQIRLFPNGYVEPPYQSGPLVAKESVPASFLLETEGAIVSAVATYSEYLERFIKGSTYGLVIGEVLRKEIATNWRPGMPFRYYDSKKGKLFAMRMDAVAWGVDTDGSAIVTNGIWIGESNGTVAIPSNVSGDSRPDMGSGTLPPVGPGAPPSISGETSVLSGPFIFDVNVFFDLSSSAEWVEPTRLADTGYVLSLDQTFTCFVGGLVVTAGDLLSADPSGSIPIDYLGSLVTAGATIVQANIFG